MGIFRRNPVVELGEEIAVETVAHSDSGGRVAAVISAIALVLSLYSLWETSLKRADLHVFVPPVVHYAAPNQNSNFEVIAIPVTIANEGAQTGTVLTMELAVTDPRTNQTKRFYSADFGRWTMERTRSGAYQPFAPIALLGHSSRTESVLFYTRGEEEKPDQLIREPGPYRFILRLEEAADDGPGPFDWLWRRQPTRLTFERELRFYDARAFNTGTLPMYARDWTSAKSEPGK
jgi:hypothetical protein